MKKAVVVLSGGLDSSTLAYHVKDEGFEVKAISFNYGQRHSKELIYASEIAGLLDVEHQVVDLSKMRGLLAGSGSSLVTGNDVPEGHYAEENMKATVVPNRNMIMLSIASAWAVSIGAEKVCTGVHAGDHAIYPDCRPEFIGAVTDSVVIGNEGFIADGFFIDTPFIKKSKNDIAFRALELNVPIAMTWSCYKGGIIHCGKCGTCVERLEAIDWALGEYYAGGDMPEPVDPTAYEDRYSWREVVEA